MFRLLYREVSVAAGPKAATANQARHQQQAQNSIQQYKAISALPFPLTALNVLLVEQFLHEQSRGVGSAIAILF